MLHDLVCSAKWETEISPSRVFQRTSRFPKPSMWATSRTMREPHSWAASSTPAFLTQSSLLLSRSRRRCGSFALQFITLDVSISAFIFAFTFFFNPTLRSSRSWLRGNRLRSEKSTQDSPVLRKEFGRFPLRAFPEYVCYLWNTHITVWAWAGNMK